MIKKDEIIKLIEAKTFANKNVVKSLLLPSIGFKIESKEVSFSSPSSIGGHSPIDDSEIKFLGKKNLNLLAKISLNQISEMNNILPKEGIIYFFICTENLGNRFPDKKDEFKVVYLENFSDGNNLLKKNNTIESYPITFFEYYTFPSYQEAIFKKNNITDDEIQLIDDITEEILFSINEDFEIPHQLLGYPMALQGTVKFWWAAKYLEINTNTEISKEDMDRINWIAEDFILLLQIDFSDSKIEIDNFGDSIAYFGIHKTDLINRDFSKVVLEMQNT